MCLFIFMVSPAIIVGLSLPFFLLKKFDFSSFFTLLYFLFSVLSGVIYGRYAFEIHNCNGKVGEKLHRLNQYWFNGLGAFLGWCFLYYFLVFRIELFQMPNVLAQLLNKKLDWADFVVILISYVGITGHLPFWTLFGNKPK